MIRIQDSDDQRVITLDRTDKANALTKEMMQELVKAYSTAGQFKSVVLTGAGTVFCAGADLAAAKAGLATDPIWHELSTAIKSTPGFTIAALNGTAAGGAMGMVLDCDCRIAMPHATFFYPVMQHGFLPQAPHVDQMKRLIGPARTKLILVAGQKLNAQTAFSYGLIDHICDGELWDAVDNTCSVIRDAAQDHVCAVKRMIEG